MRSMTGYGHSVYTGDGYSLDLQIKSVNNRYLEVVQNLSPVLSEFSSLIESEVKKASRRGRVEVSAKVSVSESKVRLHLDEGLLAAYSKIFSRISEETGAPPASVSDYMAVEGLVTADAGDEAGRFEPGLRSALSDALSQFKASREREGEGTRENLMQLGRKLEGSLESVASYTSQLEEIYKARLTEKYEELSGEKGDTPDFLQELGVILVRYTINEEINRLRVHLKEYWKLMDSAESIGKTLDFLAQEMQRECNTIASKSQIAQVNLLVVSMKDDIENIREQSRNVE